MNKEIYMFEDLAGIEKKEDLNGGREGESESEKNKKLTHIPQTQWQLKK